MQGVTSMHSAEIQRLIEAVEAKFGPVAESAGSAGREHGAGFRLSGIAATFSVHTADGTLPPDRYDIQIENEHDGQAWGEAIEGLLAGEPPDRVRLPDLYVYADEVSLDEFLVLVRRMTGPEEHWPTTRDS